MMNPGTQLWWCKHGLVGWIWGRDYPAERGMTMTTKAIGTTTTTTTTMTTAVEGDGDRAINMGRRQPRLWRPWWYGMFWLHPFLIDQRLIWLSCGRAISFFISHSRIIDLHVSIIIGIPVILSAHCYDGSKCSCYTAIKGIWVLNISIRNSEWVKWGQSCET
jgi:hypothetical protein